MDFDYLIFAEGYHEQTDFISVTDRDLQEDVQLEAIPGTITGQVDLIYLYDDFNERMPLSDVLITVLINGKEVDMRGTNQEGRYELEHIPVNTDLVIVAEYFGETQFELSSDILQVKPGETLEVNFEYEYDPFAPHPFHVEISEVSDESLTVSWELYYDPYRYRVYLNEEFITETAFDRGESTFTELVLNREYVVRVEAWWPGEDFPDAAGEVAVRTLENDQQDYHHATADQYQKLKL